MRKKTKTKQNKFKKIKKESCGNILWSIAKALSTLKFVKKRWCDWNTHYPGVKFLRNVSLQHLMVIINVTYSYVNVFVCKDQKHLVSLLWTNKQRWTINFYQYVIVCATIKHDLIFTICYRHNLFKSMCTMKKEKKSSTLFLLCTINKYAAVRLHRPRLLCMNSPSSATKRYIYLYIYIFRTMFKDHAGVCASACSPHLIKTSAADLSVSSFLFFSLYPPVTKIQMCIIINCCVEEFVRLWVQKQSTDKRESSQ